MTPFEAPPAAPCARVERVGGGDINDAYKVQFDDESFGFVKTRPDVAPGEYAAEAAGLRWLAEPGALRVPEVLGVSDEVLVLDWVDEGAPRRPGRVRRGPRRDPRGGRRGLRRPASRCGIGARSRCPTTPRAGLAHVLRERRLLPAAAPRRLPRAGNRAVERVCDRIARARRARPSRPRACTATCGAATCCGAARAARG